MDKNSIFGIVLIAAILIIWGVTQKPNPKQIEAQRKMQDTTAIAGQAPSQVATDEGIQQSLQKNNSASDTSGDFQKLQQNLGEFASKALGNNQFFTIENDLLKLRISTRGGRPYSVELKKYKTFSQQPVVLFDGDSTEFGLNFYYQHKQISTNNLFFQPLKLQPVIVSAKADSLTMRLSVNGHQFIEYRYTLHPGSYMIDYTIRLNGMQDMVTRDPSTLDFAWEANIPQHEQLKKNENQYTTLFFRHHKEDVDFFRARSSKDVQQQNIPTQIQWVAFKNQFFASVILCDEAFSNALLKSSVMPATSKYLKNFRAELGIPLQNRENGSVHMKMFFGPNKFRLLKQYGDYQLHNLVSVGRGIIRWINQFVIIPIFDWLSRYIGNFGLIILLLTIIIKAGLLPLTYKSYLSQARMKVLKPQIDELSHKFPKGKELEKQQATMALYKKAGINPMGGCLPMLLQLPILLAMFRFFPTSIELRQEGFLWVKDLSTFDSIFSWDKTIPIITSIYGNHISLFTILMTVSTIISMKMSDTTSSTQQMPGMKTMMYTMPVVFMFALNSFSAGLTYYYFLANVITIGQNYLFKQFIDEKEILRKIEEKKAKPVKKSKFQQRLEAMAKQSANRKPVRKK